MRRVLLTVATITACVSAWAVTAAARTLGTLPPHHPASDCSGYGLSGIDKCRRAEGIGPLVLPRNFTHLNAAEQLLVVIDLERVNRGLKPITVLLAPLDTLAKQGAEARTDPAFPAEGGTHGYFRGGGIWATADPPSLLEADMLWMYQDAGSAWGHRDNILLAGSNVVGGGGATRDNWDFEMLAGYTYSPTDVVFRWSSELRYFAKAPGLEPRA